MPVALLVRAQLDANRVREAPSFTRIEIGVDPAVTSGEDSDETGIVVAGKGADGHGYVLEDLSCCLSPDFWVKRVVEAYCRHKANRIVAEVSNGGDLVVSLIKTVDARVVALPVRARHGKRARAEPVAALYNRAAFATSARTQCSRTSNAYTRPTASMAARTTWTRWFECS